MTPFHQSFKSPKARKFCLWGACFVLGCLGFSAAGAVIPEDLDQWITQWAPKVRVETLDRKQEKERLKEYVHIYLPQLRDISREETSVEENVELYDHIVENKWNEACMSDIQSLKESHPGRMKRFFHAVMQAENAADSSRDIYRLACADFLFVPQREDLAPLKCDVLSNPRIEAAANLGFYTCQPQLWARIECKDAFNEWRNWDKSPHQGIQLYLQYWGDTYSLQEFGDALSLKRDLHAWRSAVREKFLTEMALLLPESFPTHALSQKSNALLPEKMQDLVMGFFWQSTPKGVMTESDFEPAQTTMAAQIKDCAELAKYGARDEFLEFWERTGKEIIRAERYYADWPFKGEEGLSEIFLKMMKDTVREDEESMADLKVYEREWGADLNDDAGVREQFTRQVVEAFPVSNVLTRNVDPIPYYFFEAALHPLLNAVYRVLDTRKIDPGD